MSKDRMLKKGDSVVMHTCGEATFPKYFGKVWTCKTDEFITGEGKGLYEQRLVFLEGFSGSFATDYLQYIDLELARSAPETTALPSETAADKGILTEEELKERNRKLVYENDEQLALLKKAGDFIDAIMSFYGQNLMVMGWHQNGDGEPFDNFIEDNLDETLLEELKSALEELK